MADPVVKEPTMKAWKIRAIVRDREGIIIGYQRPKTVPPDLGKKLITRYPLEWDVVDRNWDVPADPRIKPREQWRMIDEHVQHAGAGGETVKASSLRGVGR